MLISRQRSLHACAHALTSSTTLTSAPFSSSILAMGPWFKFAAQCNGLSPSWCKDMQLTYTAQQTMKSVNYWLVTFCKDFECTCVCVHHVSVHVHLSVCAPPVYCKRTRSPAATFADFSSSFRTMSWCAFAVAQCSGLLRSCHHICIVKGRTKRPKKKTGDVKLRADHITDSYIRPLRVKYINPILGSAPESRRAAQISTFLPIYHVLQYPLLFLVIR